MSQPRGCYNSSRTKTTYYSMTAFHVGMKDITSWNPGCIKEDYQALGVQARSIGVHVIFSSILTVRIKGAARSRCIMQINFWLCGWCCPEGYGFYNNGIFFNNCILLGSDKIHLSRRGKGIFGGRLASLVTWALH